jgi:hypothetical protein
MMPKFVSAEPGDQYGTKSMIRRWTRSALKKQEGRRRCRPFFARTFVNAILLHYALAYARATAPNSLRSYFPQGSLLSELSRPPFYRLW